MSAPQEVPTLFYGNGQDRHATGGATLAFGQATQNDGVDSQRSAVRRPAVILLNDWQCYFCGGGHAFMDDKCQVVCRQAVDSGSRHGRRNSNRSNRSNRFDDRNYGGRGGRGQHDRDGRGQCDRDGQGQYDCGGRGCGDRGCLECHNDRDERGHNDRDGRGHDDRDGRHDDRDGRGYNDQDERHDDRDERASSDRGGQGRDKQRGNDMTPSLINLLGGKKRIESKYFEDRGLHVSIVDFGTIRHISFNGEDGTQIRTLHDRDVVVSTDASKTNHRSTHAIDYRGKLASTGETLTFGDTLMTSSVKTRVLSSRQLMEDSNVATIINDRPHLLFPSTTSARSSSSQTRTSRSTSSCDRFPQYV